MGGTGDHEFKGVKRDENTMGERGIFTLLKESVRVTSEGPKHGF